MAYQVTVTVRRKRTVYQRQEVTATFTEAQAREHHGYGENEEMTEDDIADYALEVAETAAKAAGWSTEDTCDEPLDPSDDLEITEIGDET